MEVRTERGDAPTLGPPCLHSRDRKGRFPWSQIALHFPGYWQVSETLKGSEHVHDWKLFLGSPEQETQQEMHVLSLCFSLLPNLTLFSLPCPISSAVFPSFVSSEENPFPPSLSNSYLSFKICFRWHLLISLSNPSLAPPWRVKNAPALLCPYYICVLTERGIRDWKTWTDISIQPLIDQFTPWLSLFSWNQRDPECTSYFFPSRHGYLGWEQTLKTPE